VIIPLTDWAAESIQVFVGTEAISPSAHADHVEKIVLDLHVGSAYYEPGPGTGTKLNPGERLKVRPGRAVRIYTSESFVLPKNVFGELVSRASLTARGLVAANIKLDPSFSGQLHVTLFNVSTDTVFLKADEAFCSVFFHKLDREVDGNTRRAPDPPVREKGVAATLSRHSDRLITVGIALSVSIIGSGIAQWIL